MDESTDEIIPEASEAQNVHMLMKIVILGIIGVVSILGNLITLGTLCMYKSLRIPIYIVIGGLSLADIILTVMNIPENIMHEAEKGEHKMETWCKVYGFLSNSCQYLAAFHLVVLGVLRGILLTDRAHHGPSVIHAIGTCALLWIATLLANIPMINTSVKEEISWKCVVEAGDWEERYIVLSALFSYFLPLLLIIIIYLFTGYMSKRFFEDSYSRRERRMSKMISCLIVVFALCRLPLEMVTLLWYYKYKYIKDDFIDATEIDRQKYVVWVHVRGYLSILSMIDMALRPVIYATMSRDFGSVFDKVINCTYCKSEEEEEEEATTRLRQRGEEIQEVYRAPAEDRQRYNTDTEEIECL